MNIEWRVNKTCLIPMANQGKGDKRKMRKKMVKCARCNGKGSIRESGLFGPGKEKACPVCGGSGKVEQK